MWPCVFEGHGQIDPLTENEIQKALLLERFQSEVFSLFEKYIYRTQPSISLRLSSMGKCLTQGTSWVVLNIIERLPIVNTLIIQ